MARPRLQTTNTFCNRQLVLTADPELYCTCFCPRSIDRYTSTLVVLVLLVKEMLFFKIYIIDWSDCGQPRAHLILFTQVLDIDAILVELIKDVLKSHLNSS